MIGQAMMSYASSHGHAYPPSFATLYMNGDIGSEFFVCPKTNHRPARGPTTVAIAAKLAGPPNCSYIYLAAGMTDAAPASAILAYEPASNHDGCSNALFGDGHVEFLTPTELKTALAPPVATVPTWPVLVTTRPVTSAPTAN